MITRLFDVQNGVVVPTEHCYTLKALKDIMDKYPEDHLKIYLYLFYMTCPNPDMNPFFHTPEIDKEPIILQEIQAEFSPEEDDIFIALQFCQRMYETPTSRAYKGMASMLDRLARYMETTQITAGRDGNINSLVAAAKNFDQIRASFKGVYKDLQDEQSSKVRGGQGLAYDS
jgi:hypothetical protein|tara:strand:+ start:3750 stop:4265 length:516 start_codon:yes stop_codon:yes gene_type:complete